MGDVCHITFLYADGNGRHYGSLSLKSCWDASLLQHLGKLTHPLISAIHPIIELCFDYIGVVVAGYLVLAFITWAGQASMYIRACQSSYHCHWQSASTVCQYRQYSLPVQAVQSASTGNRCQRHKRSTNITVRTKLVDA